MKKQYLTLAAFILLAIVSGAEGTRWEYFMQNSRGDNYYVDLDTIEQSSPDTFRISKKLVPKQPSKYSSLVSSIDLNCQEKGIRLLQETVTYENGEVRTFVRNEKWHSVHSDDTDELLLEFICSLKKVRN
jgi:hypothetical protein